VSLRAHDFAVIARPVIDELYRITPKGQRPDANDLAARLYDALNAAGADVAIKPPVPPTVVAGPTKPSALSRETND
jgi:hypothetical protein